MILFLVSLASYLAAKYLSTKAKLDELREWHESLVTCHGEHYNGMLRAFEDNGQLRNIIDVLLRFHLDSDTSLSGYLGGYLGDKADEWYTFKCRAREQLARIDNEQPLQS